MTPRDLACQAMWSEKPLVQLFKQQTGRQEFSLKELITFAEALPMQTLENVAGRAVRTPAPCHRARQRRPIP